MKKSRFSDCVHLARRRRKARASRRFVARPASARLTYYNWRKKYGGLMPSEMKRLKQPDEENRRLKKLVADLSLDKVY